MKDDSITLREGHAAVNVKVQQHIPVPASVPEDVKQRVWDWSVDQFWRDIIPLAHKRGYASVFSEGRSGGWAVPFYQTSASGQTKFTEWPGSGEVHGHPRYPDVEHSGAEREKFRAFQRDVRALIEDAKKRYVEECIVTAGVKQEVTQ